MEMSFIYFHAQFCNTKVPLPWEITDFQELAKEAPSSVNKHNPQPHFGSSTFNAFIPKEADVPDEYRGPRSTSLGPYCAAAITLLQLH